MVENLSMSNVYQMSMYLCIKCRCQMCIFPILLEWISHWILSLTFCIKLLSVNRRHVKISSLQPRVSSLPGLISWVQKIHVLNWWIYEATCVKKTALPQNTVPFACKWSSKCSTAAVEYICPNKLFNKHCVCDLFIQLIICDECTILTVKVCWRKVIK